MREHWRRGAGRTALYRVTMNHFRLHSEQTDRAELHEKQAAELSSTDALFAMLDGQIIRGRYAAWRAEVVGILAEEDETWVQIAPAQRPALSLVMRLDREPQADRVLEALRAWTDLPEERRPGRIDLMAYVGSDRLHHSIVSDIP